MAITITHSHAEGTLVSGTARGDGTALIVKSYGLRWSRNLGAWYIPQSRDKPARTGYRGLELLKDALQGAGFECELSIDNERRATADVQADRLERAAGRAEHLDGKAERLAAKADEHHERSRAATAGIEFGQPILVGHHSERRHRNAIEKSWTQMGKAVETSREAEGAANGAAAARATIKRSDDPGYIQNRIDDAERDLRAANRGHRLIDGGYTGPLNGRVEEAIERLAYWRGELQRVQEAGRKVYTRADIKAGDFVKIRHGWSEVVRANPKTVSAMVGMPWPLKYKYAEIRGHRTAAQVAAAAAAADDTASEGTE